MRVLITNDDGIDSHGIAVLARVAVEAGHDVVVAAPHEERSGASASLSALQNRDQLVVSRASVADLDVDAFAVQASPAMIAFVATRGAFGPRPDILLSGINHGPNTGSAVLHSGTVGAALTASTHGVPAMALSLAGLDTASLAAPGDIHDQIDREVASGAPSWDTAHLVARRALDWFVDHGAADWVLNVNIPPVAPSELRGIRPADLAAFGAVQAEIGDTDDEFVTVRFDAIHARDDDDSDAGLVARGWATTTALRPPSRVDVDLAGLE
ncbi:5'/3'-nucleotidase SurE [Rhodococcus sp. BP-149]|uniref:5'/3'-nucleotidase SurE n=1 Tax=unclassified Rhodococcus (in: high G+C Gram-positive bacteria) TaxID=192944 RepID=UPI001C9B6094|nr:MULTISPECIES: 5'/3'-nucleotidase SurE [unclassified Rhodococcus (in: high G+C Gram-positive bacteria)]MBY6684002.1 5'/3'-nucleotidase SurE [Rhodococcus sp. BP-288]MBY6693337.1 5'/3'-nucleotidase SurE [Rhodococcus sp. BP-188]MBY6697534.1 5'/3'-nucleotidase SurE [Rhodococcus sp. BP-285]MBY6702211.1 5'/3'-nucleotidase SurE [Rhodococcus sp. BP-283]MBY6706510.1 5'/3'-nucleotidase SurE [Rhodococcus sp. BP-241]